MAGGDKCASVEAVWIPQDWDPIAFTLLPVVTKKGPANDGLAVVDGWSHGFGARLVYSVRIFHLFKTLL